MVIVLLGLLHFFAFPKMSDAGQPGAPAIERPVLLSYLEPHSRIMSWNIDYQPLQQTRFQIFSKGCVNRITINNDPVPFNDRLRCDFYVGMTVNFAPFLKTGRNLLTIETDRPDDLQIGPLLFDHDHWMLTDWLGLCLIGTACAGLILFMYRCTGEALSGCLLAGGLLIYSYYFVLTSFLQFKMDMPGHLEYVSFIATHGYWPKPYERGAYPLTQFYHPPLYYSLQALILVAVNWLGSFDPASALRVFSLGCFMASLVFAALTLRRLIRQPLAYYTALLLMVFYPCSIIWSASIDSNLLFYAFCTGCLYFTLRWLEESKDRHLALALIMLGFGLATRSNALILFPLLGLAGIYQWRKRGWPVITLRSTAVCIGLIAVGYGVIADFGRTAYYHYAENRHESFIVGNSNVLKGGRLAITNDSIGKFILLDFDAYITRPFWSVWKDDNGRQYFWNSLLKSSLFGEYTWNQGEIAKILSILLLALIFYTGASALIRWRDIKGQWQWWFSAGVLFIPIFGLMVNRWLFPFACSQDFRYIYPSLMGFCGMFGIAIEQHLIQRHYTMAGCGIVLATVFATCSALFFLTQ